MTSRLLVWRRSGIIAEDMSAAAADERPTMVPVDSADISEEREAQIFWRVRWQIFRATLTQTLTTSRLRVVMVVTLSLLFWSGLFWLFYEGFELLIVHVGAAGVHHERVLQQIYNLFFAALMVMLLFSSGIIMYGSLYRSAETEFLLTLPARASRIVLHRFQEALVLSSWGFVLLASPMLIAYGLVAAAPWYYYAFLAPFLLAFAYIPGVAGAVLCLLIIHRASRFRWHLLSATFLAFVLFFVLCLYLLIRNSQAQFLSDSWFDETVRRFAFTEQRLLPSWWLSTGLLEAAQSPAPGLAIRPWIESALYLALLLTNAMVGHLILIAVGHRVFRASCSALAGSERPHRPAKLATIDRFAYTVSRFLPRQVRLLLVKDFRVFRRDPVQWSQFLIFFGLLGFYFLNIRRFNYQQNHMAWINMVSFLNLAVVGLILSTFTTRFVFPMISLEGNRFWVLGLLPMHRDAILWGKFLFASLGSLIPCSLLVFVSDVMLNIEWSVVVVHQLTVVALCVGLSAIAVGLGAKLPDLRQQSPSKIAAGFGGTLTLVLSALYVMALVALTAIPAHYQALAWQSQADGREVAGYVGWSIGGAVATVVCCCVATGLPLRLGIRAFREMEF